MQAFTVESSQSCCFILQDILFYKHIVMCNVFVCFNFFCFYSVKKERKFLGVQKLYILGIRILLQSLVQEIWTFSSNLVRQIEQFFQGPYGNSSRISFSHGIVFFPNQFQGPISFAPDSRLCMSPTHTMVIWVVEFLRKELKKHF